MVLCFEAAPAKEVGRRGRETRLFAEQKCRALLVYKQSYGCFEMVLFPVKTFALYGEQVKFKIFAIQWFSL